MKTPYFSIVTVCFNSSKTIRETFESILKQTFTDYEYIVVDGGSKDGTLDIIREYEKKLPGKLIYVSEPDNGLYDAMNKGIRMASGHYISILNSDDYYHSDTLQTVYELTKEKSDYLVVFGDIQRVSECGAPIYNYHFDYSRIENKIAFGHPSMFVTKKLYDEIGEYDCNYSLAADIDFQYRMYQNEKIDWVVSDKTFTYMREGGATDNLSNKKKWIEQLVAIEVKYKGKKYRTEKIKIFIGMWGRAIKNKLPYKVQRMLYESYRK